jgi:hypothetical protein
MAKKESTDVCGEDKGLSPCLDMLSLNTKDEKKGSMNWQILRNLKAARENPLRWLTRKSFLELPK